MSSPQESVESRLIRLVLLGFGVIALLTVGTAWLSIDRIESQLSSESDVRADSYRSLLRLDGIANDAVQELFGYLVSGHAAELRDFRVMAGEFNQEAIRYASLAKLASPESKAKFAAFREANEAWSESLTLADRLVAEYQATGAVSPSAFEAYEQRVDGLFTGLDEILAKSQGGVVSSRESRDRVISESQRMLAIVAGVSLLALVAIGSLLVSRILAFLRRLREQDDELEILAVAMDSTTAGFCYSRADGDQTLMYVNEALISISGYSREELIGQNCRMLQGPETDPAQVAEIRAAIAAGREVGVTIRNYRKDGEPFWNQLLISPVRDSSGRLTHFVGAMHDVTERIELSDQLLRSQKLEAIGQLAGGIAHDFNNYLTVINGNAEVILATTEDAELREDAQQILEAGDRSAELTRQLLAFSRRQILVPEILDLNRVVLDMDPLLRRTLGENIRLQTVTAGGLGMVSADQAKIEQVILNLVVNARDAMPKGGDITLETANVFLDAEYVELAGEGAEGRHVMIAVSDSGDGIPDDVLPRIYDPFFTTKVSGGSGLGLSTVIGIVEQSGGSVRVYSEPGEGSTFKVYLPRVSGSAKRSTAVEADVSMRLDGRVLVVDDKEMVLDVTCQMVRGLGLQAVAAASAEAALDILHAGHAIDLLLTDVMLPEMGGRELAQIAQQEFPSLRVLYMSGYTENGIIHAGRLDEGIQFVHKPFSRRDLALKIAAALASESPPAGSSGSDD